MGKKTLLKSTAKKKQTKKTTSAKKAGAEKKKAEAEKIAAEKAEEERLSTEKAEAERKAEEERLEKEKAEAERKAEEERLAAEEKKQAETQKIAEEEKKKAEDEIKIPQAEYTPPIIASPVKEKSDPIKKLVIAVAACLIVIISPIVFASIFNMSNYYLKSKNGAVEIWKGNFAPMGKHMLVTIPGAKAPKSIKELYTKKDIFPLICNYYIKKSDAVLDISGMSDFKKIRTDLEHAMNYAITKDLRTKVEKRFTAIDFMTLIYKADVSAVNGTAEGFKAAVKHLEQAALFKLDDQQAELVKNKIITYKKAAESL